MRTCSRLLWAFIGRGKDPAAEWAVTNALQGDAAMGLAALVQVTDRLQQPQDDALTHHARLALPVLRNMRSRQGLIQEAPASGMNSPKKLCCTFITHSTLSGRYHRR